MDKYEAIRLRHPFDWVPALVTTLLLIGVATTFLWRCTGAELTVKDAELGLQLACQSLATVLQSETVNPSEAAWQLAIEACNGERTTKIMRVLLTEHEPLETIELAPSPFPSTDDAGAPPAAPFLP